MDATTIQYLAIVWILVAIIAFPFMLKITQPYGRHSKKNWGPMIDNRLGWIFMESPSFFIFISLVLFGSSTPSQPVWILFGLWAIHYFNRSFVFPLRTKTNGKKMPVIIMFSAILFNLVNASLNGYWFGFVAPSYPENWITDPRFIIGGLVFITGFIINQMADRKLIGLRRGGSSGYFIPRGGLFNYISCPNFFGEIVEWTGFAIMAWNLPALSFAVWTAANLIPRAMDHHRWYKSYFKDEYPKSRKALIPFVV
jgi:3-oxo-5-alpha-steroid 4-dehydrogenase 1